MLPFIGLISGLFSQLPLCCSKGILGRQILRRSVFLAVLPLDPSGRELRRHFLYPLPELVHAQVSPLGIRGYDHHIVPAAVAVERLEHTPVGKSVCRSAEVYPFIPYDMLAADLFPGKPVFYVFRVIHFHLMSHRESPGTVLIDSFLNFHENS